MIMNATPTTIHAIPMPFAPILSDLTLAIVLLDMLLMVHPVKVRHITYGITITFI